MEAPMAKNGSEPTPGRVKTEDSECWLRFFEWSDEALDAQVLEALARELNWPTFRAPAPNETLEQRYARTSVQGMHAKRKKHLPDEAIYGLTVYEIADRLDAPSGQDAETVKERLRRSTKRLLEAGRINVFMTARDGASLSDPVYVAAAPASGVEPDESGLVTEPRDPHAYVGIAEFLRDHEECDMTEKALKGFIRSNKIPHWKPNAQRLSVHATRLLAALKTQGKMDDDDASRIERAKQRKGEKATS
jgi:hypothetical protein